MPWLASYPETIAKYVATGMEIGKETEFVRNDTPELDDPDAFEKANGSSLGYVLPRNGSSMPQKFPSNHPEYHDLNLLLNGLRENISSKVDGNFPPWHTANNGQPVTHATTRGKTSKGTDGGSNRASGTTPNDGKGRGNNNKRRHAQPGGGAQGGGQDDNDDDDRNNGKKTRPSPPADVDTSEISSDDEDDKPKKPTRKPRRKTNPPRTPSPKPPKTRGRSFKQPNQTPPADYRTPSAPPISPLTNTTRSTPPQNAQPPPPQNPPTTGPRRQPLTDLPLPPSRGLADLILVPPSSSSSSSPPLPPLPRATPT